MDEEPVPGQAGQEQKTATIVTRQQAEVKAEEAQSSFSTLIDQLETSRETQGNYFVEFGQKGDSAANDSRIIMLVAPGVNGSKEQYIGITKDGIMELFAEGGRSDTMLGMTLTALSNEESFKHTVEGPDSHYGRLDVSVDNGRNVSNFHLLPFREQGIVEEVTASAIDKSIAKAESPHKHNLEQAQAKIDLAQSLGARVNALPPKE